MTLCLQRQIKKLEYEKALLRFRLSQALSCMDCLRNKTDIDCFVKHTIPYIKRALNETEGGSE